MTFWACVSVNQRRVAPLLSFLIFASSPVCSSVPRTGGGTEGFKKLSKGVDWKQGERESQHKSKVKGRGHLKRSLQLVTPFLSPLREDQPPTTESCFQFLKGPDHAFYLTTVGQDSHFSWQEWQHSLGTVCRRWMEQGTSTPGSGPPAEPVLLPLSVCCVAVALVAAVTDQKDED